MTDELSIAIVRNELNKQCGIIGAPPESHGDHNERIVCPACNEERQTGFGSADLLCTVRTNGWLNWTCFHCDSKSERGSPPAFPKTAEGGTWTRDGIRITPGGTRGIITGYVLPPRLEQRGFTPHIEQWWLERCISRDTRNMFGTFDMDTGMARQRRGINGQILKPEFIPCVVFPYFNRFDGHLPHRSVSNYKKRSVEKPKRGEQPKKMFSQSPNHEPQIYNEIMAFGSNGWTQHQELVITEGEMDVMATVQAMSDSGAVHTHNVVSLPSGSAKSDNHSRAEMFNKPAYTDVAKTIILAGDNDANGRALMSAIADVFGRERCRYVDWGEYKDANDALMRGGCTAIRDAIYSSVPMFVQDAMYPPETLNKPKQKIPTFDDQTDIDGNQIDPIILAMMGISR